MSIYTDGPFRVLQSVGGMNHGGIEHFVMDVYRRINRDLVQFDFIYSLDEPCAFDEEIERLGGRIFRIASPDRHPIRSTFFYHRFFSAHPEFKVVHEHRSTLAGVLGCLRAASSSGVPMRIVHSHSSHLAARYGAIGNLYERLSHYYNMTIIEEVATNYFACSDAAAEWMFSRMSSDCGSPEMIRNGIDCNKTRFSPCGRKHIRQKYGIPMSSIVLGHVGRFNPVKNHSFLFEIMASFPDSSRPYLLLLGDGDLVHELKVKVRELGISKQVIFAGFQDNLAPYYSAMDCLVMPSLYEGMPISAIEAQASGLTLVLSDSISKDVAITDRVRFASLSDGPRAWAELLSRLHFDNDKRDDYFQLVADRGYDINDVVNYLQRLYLSAYYER